MGPVPSSTSMQWNKHYVKTSKVIFFFPNKVHCLHLNLLMDSFCSKTGMKNGFGNADSDPKILLEKKKNEDFKKIEE